MLGIDDPAWPEWVVPRQYPFQLVLNIGVVTESFRERIQIVAHEGLGRFNGALRLD